jgi:hypothetical protein
MHLRVEDGGVTDNDHLGLDQGLRLPDGGALGVSSDVLRAVIGVADVRGPPEVFVQEISESCGVRTSSPDATTQ